MGSRDTQKTVALQTHIAQYQEYAFQLLREIEGRQDEAAIQALDEALAATRQNIVASQTHNDADAWLKIRFFLDEAMRSIEPNPDMETARLLINQIYGERLIDDLDARVSVIGPDFRYRNTSTGNAQFYARERADMVGMHVGEIIGRQRFELRAKLFLEHCFAGNRTEYFHVLHDDRGERIMRCIMEPAKTNEAAAVVTMADITGIVQTVSSIDLVSLDQGSKQSADTPATA